MCVCINNYKSNILFYTYKIHVNICILLYTYIKYINIHIFFIIINHNTTLTLGKNKGSDSEVRAQALRHM